MRIKSNLTNNTCVAIKGGLVINIPAGAVLELEDAVYLRSQKQLAPAIKAGELEVLKGVALTPEQTAEAKAAKVIAAKEFIASVEAEEKAK